MTNRPSGNGATTVRRSEYADNLAATEIISRANFDAALGPLRRYIEDPFTTDVNVNPDGSVWVSRGTHGKTRAAETMNARQRETLIGMLANRAGSVVDRLHSRLAMDLPYYPVRVQCFAPPVGDWALCLRCHAPQVTPLVDRGDMMTGFAPASSRVYAKRGYAGAIADAVERRENVGIVGRPGAGKTTFLDTLLHESARLRPDARLVSLEDRRELHASHADTLQLYAKVEQAYPNGTRFEYSFHDLLEDVLRTSSDILAYGELRSGAATVSLLAAMNTGVSGLMFTLHASSAVDALSRLEDLLKLAGAPVIRRTIARFVQMFVFLDMGDDRVRRVAEVVRVVGVDADGEYMLESVHE
jgi:pilus assembly protein CpaF